LQDENYWLKHLFQDPGPKIVSDVRLVHEYQFFKQKGAFMIRLEASQEVRAQRGTLVSETDATECELDTVTDWDVLLKNEGSMESFQSEILKLSQQLISSANKP
jgi:hypothetical protein